MKRKKILRICAIAVLAAALAGGLYLRSIRDYKARVEALAFTDIDLRQVADGTYFPGVYGPHREKTGLQGPAG